MSNRKNELSIASIVFMLLVIFIHVVAECVDGYVVTSVQFAVICSLHRLASFVVQGFIFLSGVKLFMNYRDNFSYSKFYLSRLKRVFLPYVIVFSLFYLYFTLTGAVAPSASEYTVELLTGGLVGHFYFVAIIFQFYLLMPLWRLVYRCKWPTLVLIVSLALMLVCKEHLPQIVKTLFDYEMKYNSRLFTYYLFYFVAGIFAGKYYNKFIGFVQMRKWIIYAITSVVGLVDCVVIYVIRRGIYYPVWAENWHVLYCVLAISSVISVAMTLSKTKPAKTRALKLLDSASYNVYLVHPLFIFFIDSVSNSLGITSLTLRLVIKGAFAFVFAIGGCVMLEIIKAKLIGERLNN